MPWSSPSSGWPRRPGRGRANPGAPRGRRGLDRGPPAGILPLDPASSNHGDHGSDRAQVVLDPSSLVAVPRVLPQLADPLLRQLVWGTLWEMVRAARDPSLDFLDLGRHDPAG